MKKQYIVLGAVSLILVLAVVYRVSRLSGNGQGTPAPTSTPTISQITNIPTITETPMVTPSLITYDEKSPAGYDYFFESQPVIGGQQAYIAYPKTVDPQNLPKVAVYYHGSGQQITKNFSDQVMKNMRSYGAYFTKRNMVFIASNQHGDNYGSAAAIDDSVKAIDYVRSHYQIQSRYYVFGFSMGGKPALRHVLTHPNLVDRLALLAPVNDIEHYSAAEKATLAKLPIKIWHGTSDVNVPYSATTELIQGLSKYKPQITLVTLTGKTHWDVDTEYMQQIYEFFTAK